MHKPSTPQGEFTISSKKLQNVVQLRVKIHIELIYFFKKVTSFIIYLFLNLSKSATFLFCYYDLDIIIKIIICKRFHCHKRC